ncbi:MAG: hypothetical protein H0V70_01520 [Ktedonobacteraceae bacterium]|nr:hypothetical protein [Ktedonobacteraceae bacterium]
MTTQENLDNEKMSSALQNIVSGIPQSPYFISTQPPDEVEYPLPDILRAQAALAAQTKSIEDIDHDPERLPTKESLQLAANKSALTFVMQYIRDNENASKDSAQLVHGFIKVFLDAYDKDLVQKRREGALLDERTARIYQNVYSDKDNHYAQGNILTGERLHHFAVVRAMRDLGLDTSLTVDAMDDIDEYVQIYYKRYNTYTPQSKEVGQFRGSGPF